VEFVIRDKRVFETDPLGQDVIDRLAERGHWDGPHGMTTTPAQTGLLHHHRKSMNIRELRIWTWVNASDCPARSYAQSVAPGAVSSLLQATYVDQEKQRKSCPYKDLCLYC